MSPTAPTFVALNDQLKKAHHRIRELEARETELLAQNRTLCAFITELTRAPPPTPLGSAAPRRPMMSGSASASAQARARVLRRNPDTGEDYAPTSASGTGRNRVKTRRSPYV